MQQQPYQYQQQQQQHQQQLSQHQIQISSSRQQQFQPQHQQITEANVPQSSHVRVASNNSSSNQGASMSSYMVPHHAPGTSSSSYPQQQQTAAPHLHQQRVSYLKKGSSNGSSHNVTAHGTGSVKKQLSHGDIVTGFSVKQVTQARIHNSTKMQQQQQQVNSAGQINTTGKSQHYQIGQKASQHHTQHGQQPAAYTQSGHQQQAAITQLHQQQQLSQQSPMIMVQQAAQQQTNTSTSNWPVHQKRASPPSGVTISAGVSSYSSQQYGAQAENANNSTSNNVGLASVGNIVKKQIKLSQPSSSSGQLGKHQRSSTSPMNQLHAQIQSQQNKSMVFNAQQQANSTVSQKIKFLLRGKELGSVNEPTPSQRQLTTKLSKQKSPKTIYEIDNNTQATFGVDENIKENQQMNFQNAPHQRHDLAQESPSIGEEMTAAHPSLQPKIATSNLRGPLNFPKMQIKHQAPQNSETHAFPGLQNQDNQMQHDGAMKIQTQEEESCNPPNPTICSTSAGLLQKKQLTQNLRYQVSAGLKPSSHKPYAAAPSVSQLSAMVDAQNTAAAAMKNNGRTGSNSKSPVHIHYHNHIQVINSSDLKGANIVSAATPSKSPKQQIVPADSLQKPKLLRQPSQTNIVTQRPVTARLGEQSNNNSNVTGMSIHPKRITLKQSGAGNAPKHNIISGKFGQMSVTPRLTTQNGQKSTPHLRTNLQVATKPTKQLAAALSSTGVQNVSPAGIAALALLGQGARSTADIGFADQLNAKLLDAQQKEQTQQAAAPGESELNTLTDSVDGSKVTSEALKKLQPIQSVTPQKLQQVVANKKQQTTSVPPLKLNQQEKLVTGTNHSKEANLQVTAQVSASSSKPQNTGRVSHRLKQTRRGQNSSDQNVYKHNASQKSSVGQHSSKVNQAILSSSGASSNSLTSLGFTGQVAANNTGSNKSANSILINELSKYINIREKQHQKRFQQSLAAQKQKKASTTSTTKQRQNEQWAEAAQDQEEIMDNLRHFLYFLERKKIVNITEVVQDKAKMNNLIQEIMKIDFKDFSKQSSQKFKKLRASSGSESTGSQNRVQTHARRRQGTPVNVGKQPQQTTGQHDSAQIPHQQQQHYSQQNIAAANQMHHNFQLPASKGTTPRTTAQHVNSDPNQCHQPPYEPSSSAEHSNEFIVSSHNLQSAVAAAAAGQQTSIKSAGGAAGIIQQQRAARTDSKNSSQTNLLPIHHLNIQQQQSNNQPQNATTYLAQKEANLHHQTNQHYHLQPQQQQQQQQQQQLSNNQGEFNEMPSSIGQQQQFHLTNQSSVMHMQHVLQHNYSSSQYNTSNNYVSDSSGGQVVATQQSSHQKNQLGDRLMKFTNLGSTSRNKISHGVGVSAQGSTPNTAKGSKGQTTSTTAGHHQRSSTNEQGANPPSHQPQNYANYKAVAVSQSEAGHKVHRKGNSADHGHDHSSKKSQFKISGLWDLAKHNQRGESDGCNNGHSRRASEGQIVSRGRGNDSSTSVTRQQEYSTGQAGQHNQREKRKRYKSRGGSADQGVQKEVLRLSRGSSAKRTAKEIVDYVVIDEDRFRVNDNIMRERERLIRYNKLYLRKYKQLPPTSLEFYEFVELIGKGAFGQVTLGIHKLTGRQVAIKAINKSYMQDTYSKQKVMQEVYILKKIRHSNIIRLFEVFQSPKHFLLVMEYANGGDLLQFVKKRQHLDEETAKRIFQQVVHGIAHCHCRSVLHRDIKLDNILMDENEGIKICDFGVSRLITKNQSIQEQCGTPAYLAPEIIADKGYRGYYVDLWSLGVLLYAMLQGTVPFKAKSLEALHALILSGKLEYPQPISEQATHLIQSMLQVEPGERISIPRILKHPWLGIEDDLVDEECDDHDFEMGISFRREECNFNPLSMIGMSCQNAALASNKQQKQSNQAAAQSMNPEMMADCENQAADATEETNEEILLTEQETNPMHQIGNINVLDIENLFHDQKNTVDGQNGANVGGGEGTNFRLTYDNYCAVTQDFGTYHIDEEALKVLEGFGYPRKLVIDSLHSGELNHATTCYNLLVTQ